MMSKYQCLLPIQVHTILFIPGYTPVRHITTRYFPCTQRERALIHLIELLVKMGL